MNLQASLISKVFVEEGSEFTPIFKAVEGAYPEELEQMLNARSLVMLNDAHSRKHSKLLRQCLNSPTSAFLFQNYILYLSIYRFESISLKMRFIIDPEELEDNIRNQLRQVVGQPFNSNDAVTLHYMFFMAFVCYRKIYRLFPKARDSLGDRFKRDACHILYFLVYGIKVSDKFVKHSLEKVIAQAELLPRQILQKKQAIASLPSGLIMLKVAKEFVRREEYFGMNYDVPLPQNDEQLQLKKALSAIFKKEVPKRKQFRDQEIKIEPFAPQTFRFSRFQKFEINGVSEGLRKSLGLKSNIMPNHASIKIRFQNEFFNSAKFKFACEGSAEVSHQAQKLLRDESQINEQKVAHQSKNLRFYQKFLKASHGLIKDIEIIRNKANFPRDEERTAPFRSQLPSSSKSLKSLPPPELEEKTRARGNSVKGSATKTLLSHETRMYSEMANKERRVQNMLSADKPLSKKVINSLLSKQLREIDEETVRRVSEWASRKRLSKYKR